MLKSAPSGRDELNRRHARALSVSFERPRSPTWTSPQLTTTTKNTSAFLESSSLCHVLCECHNKAGVGTNVDIRPSNSFLIQRICLHSDTPRQSYCKESDAATLPIPSPSLSHPCSRRRDRRSKLRKACRTKHDNKELISI